MKRKSLIIDPRQADEAQKERERQKKVKATVGRDIDVTLTTIVNVGLCCLFCDNLKSREVIFGKHFFGLIKQREWHPFCKAMNHKLDSESIESNFAPCNFDLYETTVELDNALTIRFLDIEKGKLINPKILSKREFLQKKYGIEMEINK